MDDPLSHDVMVNTMSSDQGKGIIQANFSHLLHTARVSSFVDQLPEVFGIGELLVF